MKISKLVYDKPFKDLNPINISDKPFGKVVALVGKNGAGKSRILELIEQLATIHSECIFNGTFDGYSISEDLIIKSKKLKTLETRQKNNNSTKEINNQIAILKTELISNTKNFINEINSYIKRIDNDIFKELSKIQDKNFEILLNNNNPQVNEIQYLNSSNFINYLQTFARKYEIENIRCLKSKKKFEESQIYIDFNKIIDHVNQFLNKKIHYNENFNQQGTVEVTLTLDKKKFEFNYLSPGEKALFAYGILSYLVDINKNIPLKDSIIIVDEPEKSLHPEAQVLFINKLREIVTKGTGQVWIATHSVNIISQLNTNEVYLVKDNEIFTPSHKLQSITIEELFGKNNDIFEKLQQFIISIDERDFANFTYECLNEPKSIKSIAPNDPQIEVFIKSLENDNNIELLDFGAGSGRIGNLINNSDLKNRIKYTALEIDTDKASELRKELIGSYVLESCEQLPYNKFDIVLLSNVLHEIPPTEWVLNFNHIKRSLKTNGRLVIIEDLFLPKGELPNDYGFFLLNKEQLTVLFNSENISLFTSSKLDYSDRILCAVVERKNIMLSINTVEKTIEKLKNDSIIEIKELRKNKSIEKRGKKLALYSQMVPSCEIVLPDIKKIPFILKVKNKDEYYIQTSKGYKLIYDSKILKIINIEKHDIVEVEFNKNEYNFFEIIDTKAESKYVRTKDAYYLMIENFLHWIPNPKTLSYLRKKYNFDEFEIDDKAYLNFNKGIQIKDFSNDVSNYY
ncbi:MAG: hypothetical protein A2033_18800 [Bacteroidetes bacterium GWA2_31_9]|nr:MAG: hypothetical protein A2033_18800 [Bacteroidetes bacterium GWA2_31_9]